MKVYLCHEFLGDESLKIQIKNKLFIATNGIRCNDHMPIYGAEFSIDDQFLQWIKYNFFNELIEVKYEI